MPFYLGADVGSTKTHIMICDERGRVRGQGMAGSGNHQVVGHEGMFQALEEGLEGAIRRAGISLQEIAAAGFGISGYDWPSDRAGLVATIERLGLSAPIELYNDAILGLMAGSKHGWGISLVSGTGCTCWGWNRERTRIGHVTGFGVLMGEAAGSSELVFRAMQLVGYAWSKRGADTALSAAFIHYAGAVDLDDLLEGYTNGRYRVDGQAAPLVFEVARAGDSVARQLIHWAGCELGELAKAVIRQLEFEALAFDVILTGGMFAGGPLLVEPLRAAIQGLAPGARLVRLVDPPVVGAVLIAMQAGGLQPTAEVRRNLSDGRKRDSAS